MSKLEDKILEYSLIRDDLIKMKHILKSHLYNKNNRINGICSTLETLYNCIKLKNNYKYEFQYNTTYNYIQNNLPKLTLHKILYPKSLYCWKRYKKEPRIKWLNKNIKKLDKEIEKVRLNIIEEYILKSYPTETIKNQYNTFDTITSKKYE